MALTKISRSLLDTGISDSSDATAITIDSSENVGIGTSTIDTSYSGYVGLELGAQAVINGNRTTSDTGVTSISQNGYLSSASGGSWKYKDSGKAALIQEIDDGTIRFSTTDTSGSADDALTWSERMRIDSSGNVVIGGTTAYGRLNLHGTGSTTASLTGIQESSFTSYDDNGGNAGSISGFFNFKSTTGIGGGMGIIRESASDWGTNVAFYTHPTTTSNIGDLTERMRIDSSGRLLIGLTSAARTNDLLQVNGAEGINAKATANGGACFVGLESAGNTAGATFAALNTSASVVFKVAVGGAISSTNTSITSISDERAKENIRDLEIGLNEIKQLKPRRFDWKEGKGSQTKDTMGFIAQEVEQVNGFETLIDKWDDPDIKNAKALKMGDMLPALVKAIQEQQEQIEALQSEINTLKGG